MAVNIVLLRKWFLLEGFTNWMSVSLPQFGKLELLLSSESSRLPAMVDQILDVLIT